MKDLISKTSVCEIISDILPMDGERVVEVETIYKAYDEVLKLPEEEERKKGKWIHDDPKDAIEAIFLARPKCSECGFEIAYETNYCPNCGADMRGEE